MPKFECPKCNNGSGNIKAFSHVLGGVCFQCKGTGYIEQKRAPTKSKTYSFSFLWTDPNHVNFMDGEFCKCFNKKARSYNAAVKIAEKAMKNNGAVEYKIEEAG